MKLNRNIVVLFSNKDFQQMLAGWSGLSKHEREEKSKRYDISIEEVGFLQQIWLGLDFKLPHHSDKQIEDSLNNTLWKLADRKNLEIKQSAVRKLYLQFAKVAAILLLPLVIYIAYINFYGNHYKTDIPAQQLIHVTSQIGTLTNLVLPDGTKVYLNAGSSISYPAIFEGTTRDVSITGEVYFEVVKNTKIPMVVAAKDVVLTVYGTEFNVNAFDDEEFTRVTLVKGSVALSLPNLRFKENKELFIEPGQTVTYYNAMKKMILENDEVFPFTAWKNGLLVFRNTMFGDILKQLSRKFNVDIELNDPALASVPIDATFKNENIDEILKLLSLSTSFNFYYETPKKLSDGTYAKRKIYVEK